MALSLSSFLGPAPGLDLCEDPKLIPQVIQNVCYISICYCQVSPHEPFGFSSISRAGISFKLVSFYHSFQGFVTWHFASGIKCPLEADP
jgi:hypothetical protein